jgi:hypothetical protein
MHCNDIVSIDVTLSETIRALEIHTRRCPTAPRLAMPNHAATCRVSPC